MSTFPHVEDYTNHRQGSIIYIYYIILYVHIFAYIYILCIFSILLNSGTVALDHTQPPRERERGREGGREGGRRGEERRGEERRGEVELGSLAAENIKTGHVQSVQS